MSMYSQQLRLDQNLVELQQMMSRSTGHLPLHDGRVSRDRQTRLRLIPHELSNQPGNLRSLSKTQRNIQSLSTRTCDGNGLHVNQVVWQIQCEGRVGISFHNQPIKFHLPGLPVRPFVEMLDCPKSLLSQFCHQTVPQSEIHPRATYRSLAFSSTRHGVP